MRFFLPSRLVVALVTALALVGVVAVVSRQYFSSADTLEFVAECSSTLAEAHPCDNALSGVIGDWLTKDGTPDELSGSWIEESLKDKKVFKVKGVRIIEYGAPMHDILDAHLEIKTGESMTRYPTSGGLGPLSELKDGSVLLPSIVDATAVRLVIDKISPEARHAGITEFEALVEPVVELEEADTVFILEITGNDFGASIQQVETKKLVIPTTILLDAPQYIVKGYSKSGSVIVSIPVDLQTQIRVKEYAQSGTTSTVSEEAEVTVRAYVPFDRSITKFDLMDALNDEVLNTIDYVTP